MADKRMFSREVTETDAFLDLPTSSQALWFHLGLHADDDGLVGSPKSIMRLVGGNADDLSLLVTKGFLIAFESGVIAIRHFHAMNTLKKDRVKPSVFQGELSRLELDEGKVYREIGGLTSPVPDGFQLGTGLVPDVFQPGSESVPQLVEINKTKEAKEGSCAQRTRFTPPTPQEVAGYAAEKGLSLDAERFVDYFTAQGWKLSNGNQMKDWQASVRNWCRNDSTWAIPRGGGGDHDDVYSNL